MSVITTALQDHFGPHTRCFGCGPANDKGLRIKSFVEHGEHGDVVVCSWTSEKHHEAFDGVLNGGICGTLLDCHSNWCAAWHLMNKTGATTLPCTVTSEFAVKLKRPTPTTTGPLTLSARVVESTDTQATVEATLSAKMPDGSTKVTATCRGVFVAVNEGHPAFQRWGP